MKWFIFAIVFSLVAFTGIYLISIERVILKTLHESGEFKTLITAIRKAGLEETISQEGPYTMFAPTDDAFKKLSLDALEVLLNDKELLVEILLYHIVPERLTVKAIKNSKYIHTLQGEELVVSIINGNLFIDSALLIEPGIKSANGVIYALNEILFPAR